MKYIKFSSAIIFASVCFFPNVNVYAAEFCSVAQAALSKNQLTLSLQHQIIASSERVFQSQHINGPKLDLLADLSTRNAQQGRAGLLKEGTLALSYNQTLYDSGTADLLALQAQENRKLLKMDLIATEQNSIVDAATQYLQYLQNIQLLALHHKNIKTNAKQLQNIENKLAVSEATQQEYMLVKSRVRQAMSQMLQAKAQLLISRVRLLGLSNVDVRGGDQTFLFKLLNNAPKDKQAAIAFAHKASVQVGQSAIAIDAAKIDVKIQQAKLGPKVYLSANVGFGKVGVNKGAAGQIGLNFSMPLYSNGVLESRIREAKAIEAAARAKHAYAAEQAKQNAVTSFEISKNIGKAINILPQAIRAEQSAIDSLEQSLASSLIPIAEVLLVKNSLFELRKSLIILKFEQYSANLNLLNITGKLKNIKSIKQLGLCH